MFKSINEERKTFSRKVVEHIRDLISTGRLKPGDKLPPEREFAQQLGVSRTALREAFKSLSLMGILEIKQGEGTFISRVGPPSFMKAIEPMLLLNRTDILELVEGAESSRPRARFSAPFGPAMKNSGRSKNLCS